MLSKLPNKWVIHRSKLTADECKIVNDWFNMNAAREGISEFYSYDRYIHYPAYSYANNISYYLSNIIQPEYIPITFEEFKQLVLGKQFYEIC